MKNIFILYFLMLLNGCSSHLDFTLENLNNHTHLNFTGHHGKFMSGHHDYDAGIIEFDLQLRIAKVGRFATVKIE